MNALRLLSLLLLIHAGSVYASYEDALDALDAFKQKNFEGAEMEWRRATERGDLKSQYQLAIMLYFGKYVQKNETEALALLESASAKGSPEAAYAIYVLSASKEKTFTPKIRKLLEAYISNGGAGGTDFMRMNEQYFFPPDPGSLSISQNNLLPVVFSTAESSLGPLNFANGQTLYGKSCEACHAIGAAGAPKLTDRKAWQKLAKKGLPTLTKNTILGVGAHPARGGLSLSNDEIRDTVYFMLQSATKN
ncbi:c-type cytochrome [Uliginosibacterium sp. H3]|uniref:C-type cytochrome n=1 Tax=Uliginosibacterium silvisoli TaxID=3114758 RepID=A0ABU6JYV4_9RHOO|nr:c-type cytochrome [Uliginosibacterium sp. H3]